MKRINYSFACLVFFALVVGLIIVALLYKNFSLFTSRILFFCQKLISNIMFEILRSLPDMFILATSAVLGIGLLSFLLQLGKTHFFLQKLFINKVVISAKIEKIITALGFTNKIILVNDRKLFSFCFGIFSPRIVISTALVKSLTKKELEAVLLHEESHLINKDPIKVLVGKTFSSMFFFLPVFRELHKNTEAVNEFLADQWAVNRQQKTTFLRGALKKILTSPQLNFAAVSNISGPDYFEIRIHRLVNPGIKHKFWFSLKSLITTFLFIFLSWFLLQTPVNAIHMHEESNTVNFLCSNDKSCPSECHSYSETPTYIPATPFK